MKTTLISGSQCPDAVVKNRANTENRKSQKAAREAEFRAKRKKTKQELAELHHNVVSDRCQDQDNFKIGFTARIIDRKGKVSNLPHEYAFVLKACEEFINNAKRFPKLYAWGGEAVNNIQCRRLIARVLACMLPKTDLIGGRVGVPTEAGIKTISYNELQEDYALRFGAVISPKSFDKAIGYLQRAGYFHSQRITVCVDEVQGEVRSAAAYKQFTNDFFSDLKVVRYSNIAELIKQTRERLEKKGLCFKWISFREIAKGVKDIFNVVSFNAIAESTSAMFNATRTPQPSSIPI